MIIYRPSDVSKKEFDDLMKKTKGMTLIKTKKSKKYWWRDFTFLVNDPMDNMQRGHMITYSVPCKIK